MGFQKVIHGVHKQKRLGTTAPDPVPLCSFKRKRVFSWGERTVTKAQRGERRGSEERAGRAWRLRCGQSAGGNKFEKTRQQRRWAFILRRTNVVRDVLCWNESGFGQVGEARGREARC